MISRMETLESELLYSLINFLAELNTQNQEVQLF